MERTLFLSVTFDMGQGLVNVFKLVSNTLDVQRPQEGV